MGRAVAADPETEDDRPGGAAPSRRRRAIVGVLVLAGVVALAAVVAGRGDNPADAPLTRAEVAAVVTSAVGKAIDELRNAPSPAVAAYQNILPSLVVIQSQHAGGADDERDLGTGVVVNDKGAIMTARHVVAGASVITVTFADGSSSSATVVSEQPERDIAVLTPDRPPSVIVPAVLGGGVRVGDEAYAVGHPLGLVASFSSGVISGLDRSIPSEGGVTLEGLIQFDTAVNPGNSGGPLLNRAGQVVGIVTALANPSHQGFFTGIGFAVPIGAAAGGAGGPPK